MVEICYVYLPIVWIYRKLYSVIYELTKLKGLLCVIFLCFIVIRKLEWDWKLDGDISHYLPTLFGIISKLILVIMACIG